MKEDRLITLSIVSVILFTIIMIYLLIEGFPTLMMIQVNFSIITLLLLLIVIKLSKRSK